MGTLVSTHKLSPLHNLLYNSLEKNDISLNENQ